MIDYDKKYSEKVGENLGKVREDIDQEWLKIKIDSFIQRHAVSSFDALKQMILKDDVVASFFAKDPGKQGIHEETAAKYLKDNFFPDLDVLPKSGKNAKYVVRGKISDERPNKSYKSIDFIFNYKEHTIVCSHKYTKESGGAQDNQRNDLISFIEHSASSAEKHVFVALADGPYYTNNDSKNHKILESVISKGNKIIVSTSETLKEDLDKLLD